MAVDARAAASGSLAGDDALAGKRLSALSRRIKAGYAELTAKEKEEERATPPLVIETESFDGDAKGERQ